MYAAKMYVCTSGNLFSRILLLTGWLCLRFTATVAHVVGSPACYLLPRRDGDQDGDRVDGLLELLYNDKCRSPFLGLEESRGDAFSSLALRD